MPDLGVFECVWTIVLCDIAYMAKHFRLVVVRVVVVIVN